MFSRYIQILKAKQGKMFTMFNFSERSTSQHCCSQIQNMSKLFATSNYQIRFRELTLNQYFLRFRELILNQDFFARAIQKGPGCICYIFTLSLFCIRRSVFKSQDVSVKFLDLQNLQSVSWHLEFRKVFYRTFDGWFQWLCTFSGKHGVYQHIQLYFNIQSVLLVVMVSWQSAYPQILTLFQFVSHSFYYIGLIKKKHKHNVFLTIALITNNYLHDGVMSSVVHQTIHHMWLKGGTFYKEATRKEGAVIE